jgi:hypothetical protein
MTHHLRPGQHPVHVRYGVDGHPDDLRDPAHVRIAEAVDAGERAISRHGAQVARMA